MEQGSPVLVKRTPKFNAEELAKITVELFRQGRRTISVVDWLAAYGRQHDMDLGKRLVDRLLDAAKIIEDKYRIPCTPVNEHCLSNYAEKAITDQATARRCNVFNSGAKHPVGIRRAIPDDLVRAETNGSLAHLGLGAVRSATTSNVNDVAAGITVAEHHERLISHIQAEVPRIALTKPDPVQGELTDGVDEESF